MKTVRICTGCGRNTKNFSPAQFNGKKTYPLRRCRACINARRRIRRKTGAGKVVEHHQLEKRKQMLMAFVNHIKTSTPCSDCGAYFPPVCMDFDHLNGTTKLDNVATLVHYRRSLDVIKAEIAKCELVCANCHRLRTSSRRNTCAA